MANTTLLSLKKHEREKRRELILLAAQAIFSKYGISGVNMRDIAREAGVSVGFIYRYFSGQADIFIELFEAGAGEIYDRIGDIIVSDEPHPLHALARSYIDCLHDNMMFFHMMIFFMRESNLADDALARVNTVLRSIVDRVETVFRSAGGTENSRLRAHSFFAALNGVMISFVNYPGRTPQEIRRRTLLLAETVADEFAQKAQT